MLLQEPAYLLLADVNYGGRTFSAGSVGSQEGFGTMFPLLMEAGVLHQFDPEDTWPESASEADPSVTFGSAPIQEAKSLLRLLEEGNALNRDQLARHARRLLFALEADHEKRNAAGIGPSKSLRETPSVN